MGGKSKTLQKIEFFLTSILFFLIPDVLMNRLFIDSDSADKATTCPKATFFNRPTSSRCSSNTQLLLHGSIS